MYHTAKVLNEVITSHLKTERIFRLFRVYHFTHHCYRTTKIRADIYDLLSLRLYRKKKHRSCELLLKILSAFKPEMDYTRIIRAENPDSRWYLLFKKRAVNIAKMLKNGTGLLNRVRGHYPRR